MMGLLQIFGKWAMLDFLDDLVDTVRNIIWNILGTVLWGFGSIIFVILDIFESIFKAFAGISTNGISINGKTIEGDPVLYFIQSDVVVQIFISMIILSLILLLMFTVFAIVKNQYSDKQEPISKIINSAFKGLFMYLLVPVATVVCLLVGNIVLQAINGATTNSELEIGPSGMLFKACTYNASVLREANLSECRDTLKINQAFLTQGTWDEINRRVGWDVQNNIDGITDRATMDKVAEAIDDAFANEHGGFSWNDKSNWLSVSQWYNAADVSFITLWVGGIFFIGTISKISWGVASRLFKMVIFYAVSPLIVATYPIDNGGALGKWRSSMVQLGTSAYAAVGITNVMYSILPIISAANMGSDGFANWVARIILSLLAFKSADELIKAISGWFGTGDAYSDGAAAKSKVPKLSTVATAAAGTFAGIKGGLKGAKDMGVKSKWAKFGLGAMGAFSGSGLAEKTGLDFNKFTGKAEQEKAEKYVSGFGTSFGTHAKDRKAYYENAKKREKIDALEQQYGKYELGYMTKDEIEQRRKAPGGEQWYRRQQKLGEALLALDDVGTGMYERDISEQRRLREDAEKKEVVAQEARGVYDAKLEASQAFDEVVAQRMRILGFTDRGDYNTFAKTDKGKEIITAIDSGDFKSIQGMYKGETDQSIKDALNHAREYRNDTAIIQKLSELISVEQEASREASRRASEFKRHNEADSDRAAMAKEYMNADGSIALRKLQAEETKIADTLRETAEKLQEFNNKAASAVKSVNTNNFKAGTDEKERYESYKKTRPDK